RIDFPRSDKLSFGLGPSTGEIIGGGQLDAGHHEARIDAQRLQVMIDRQLILATLVVDQSNIIVRQVMLMILLNGQHVLTNRLIRIALRVECVTKPEADFAFGRAGAAGEIVLTDGLVPIAASFEDSSKV